MRYARQILAVLIGLGIIVLVFVLVIKGFHSGNDTSPLKQTKLISYANTDAVSELDIDGPIVDDQDHQTVKITIGQNQSEIEIIKGYQGSVVAQQVFPNNSSAYAVFLQALQHMNFSKGDNDPTKSDERGYCATGNRYIYKLTNGGDQILRYWSTSCGEGTFGGNRGQVLDLFRAQIPEDVFNQLTGDIPLGF